MSGNGMKTHVKDYDGHLKYSDTSRPDSVLTLESR